MEKRVLLAAILSFIIIAGWQYFFVLPRQSTLQTQEIKKNNDIVSKNSDFKEIEDNKIKTRHDSLLNTSKQRISFENSYIAGSINLLGARIDDLTLLHYKEFIEDSSPNVSLLSPGDTHETYLATFGWLSSDNDLELPNSKSLWQTNDTKITSNSKNELTWINSSGVKFIIEIAIDDQYMFQIKQIVENNGERRINNLSNYASISRTRGETSAENMILHEGAIGVENGKLHEITFSDLEKKKNNKFEEGNGWFGFSDKYWLTAFIPSNSFSSKITSYNSSLLNEKKFQIDLISDSYVIEVQEKKVIADYKFFAGAKNLAILDQYEQKYNIVMFDHAVDFGILYFITKPIFLLLNYLYSFLGNFGLAIMLLTVLIKSALFPLAHKGFRSMNKLKELQPQLNRIKELHKDQPGMFQKAMIELYKKEKVSPVSGCLPIILQMPIFFALYKVLYVTIEMRHAPFILWIKDLSVPDTTTLFNLFGLINWQPPTFLMVGVLPILMAITIFIQQKFNPQPADPVQAKVMSALPLIFLFMFSSFPSGLLIYWTWSNILSILQQSLIKKLEK